MTVWAAFYGWLFTDDTEAAFSNYKLWESLGFITAYVCSSALCVRAKLLLLIVVLAVSALGYTAVEVAMARSQRNPQNKKV